VGKRPSERPGFLRRFQRRLKNSRRWIFGTVVAVAVWVVPKVPYPILRSLCRRLIAPWLRMRFQARARHNLKTVLGHRLDDAQISQVTFAMFGGLAQIGAEVAACMAQGPDFLRDRIDDEEALEKLRAFEEAWPGGFLGVTAHVGNWEVMAMWMAQVSRNGVGGAMAKRYGNSRLNRVVEGVRRRLGIEPIYPDDPPGKAIHLLRDKKIVGLLPDQDMFGAEGIFVDFMGRTAYTPLGPARLAWAARAPIYVGFCKRETDGRFKILTYDPIFPDRSRPKGEELARLTREWSRLVEEFILANPEQWAWLHNRWKTTPEKLKAEGRARLTFGA